MRSKKSFSLHVYSTDKLYDINPLTPNDLKSSPHIPRVGRDSSVGIAAGYGLNGPGIESRWMRDFSHPSIPAQGPIQPPIKWVTAISMG
jgi:hypothetical protein